MLRVHTLVPLYPSYRRSFVKKSDAHIDGTRLSIAIENRSNVFDIFVSNA